MLTSIGFREALNAVLSWSNVHDGDTRNLSDSALQVLIAGGHNVALVLHHAVDETVISVSSLVSAGQPLKPGVLGNPSDITQGQFRNSQHRKSWGSQQKHTSEPRGIWVPASPIPPSHNQICMEYLPGGIVESKSKKLWPEGKKERKEGRHFA